MRVLLVDNSITVRNLERKALAGMGVSDVLEAADGHEALAKLRGCGPEAQGLDALTAGSTDHCDVDLIILDLRLPRMDGIALLKELKSSARYKRIPVLTVTAESRRANVVRALHGGAVGYLLKPFQPEQLAAEVQKIRKNQEISRLRAARPVAEEHLNIDLHRVVARRKAWNE